MVVGKIRRHTHQKDTASHLTNLPKITSTDSTTDISHYYSTTSTDDTDGSL